MIKRILKYQRVIAYCLMQLFLLTGYYQLKAIGNFVPQSQFSSRNYSKVFQNKSIEFGGSNLFSSNTLLKFDDECNVGEREEFGNMSNNCIASTKQGDKQLEIEGGPGQPEMSTFKSVGVSDLVTPFTGDFSYNIPLLDVGGYPINLFYNSGVTMDQEASWVGLGWNINPGTINRNMRGIPDDFDGSEKITKVQGMRPDNTWGLSLGAQVKVFGLPNLKLGLNTGVSFNNRLGIALDAGISPSLNLASISQGEKTASLSVGANFSVNSRSGATVTPSITLRLDERKASVGESSLGGSLNVGFSYNSRMGITGMHLNAGIQKTKTLANSDPEKSYLLTETSAPVFTHSSSISFMYPSIVPSISSRFTKRSLNVSLSIGGEFYGVNPHPRIGGYINNTWIAEEDIEIDHPAYGMLYMQNANNDPASMLDFNRVNDGVYTPNSPAIAIPNYTYDIFSITGEGTGGSFRATRSDLGYARDPKVITKDETGSLGVDLGFGNAVHGGFEASYATSPTEVGEWGIGNLAKDIFKFRETEGLIQAVYFKNPGEKTIPDENFQNSIGGDNLVRLKLMKTYYGATTLLPNFVEYDHLKNKVGEKLLTSNSVVKQKRDKRTQVISFLNAEEASLIGFDKKIVSINPDHNKIVFGNCSNDDVTVIERSNLNLGINAGVVDNYRKANHISQIDVLEADGKKYVYGLPVYNILQKDVSFSIENGNASSMESNYNHGVDNMPNTEEDEGNTKGRDWYVQKDIMPAYTHSYLLTALVSPNYVDLTGDGISEDDMGEAVKFNYSRFEQGYRWRTPIKNQIASYSEGLKTDPKDDKANYVYGEREMWHLYSIESKNMIARFYVVNDRKDMRQVLSESGGIDNDWGMQRLQKICLYSKADLKRDGNDAKPITTIEFIHSYKLCKNVDGTGNNKTGEGKLTLDGIKISHNGKNRAAKSKYLFFYPEDNNPNYSYTSNDRWGNYKPKIDGSVSNNFGDLSNADFPYSVQNKVKADKYAAAWTLNKIVLPSGGKILIDYEADEYAYVQNKRASEMCQILGFGSTASPSSNQITNNTIYEKVFGSISQNDYIYIKLPQAIPDFASDINPSVRRKKELRERYFVDFTQLYLKVAVVMPSYPGNPGFEFVPVYADVDDFGLVESDIAWVKIKKLDNNRTPIVQQALQFIKQQLPGKAYPGYDVSDEASGQAVVTALIAMLGNIKALFMGDENALMNRMICKTTITSKSFVRLSNPNLKKKGGGVRVKKIQINDSWNSMTGEYDATYGQEYKYVTQQTINGISQEISSGVATWEPSIGNDENPHKEIMRYVNRNKGGPYDFGAVELPLVEMLYPFPMVGYSKVEILSIHRDAVKNPPLKQVTEFYTTKDFPTKSSATNLSDPTASIPYKPGPIMQLLKLDMKHEVNLSQGFLIDLNDMNGKVKYQATYSMLDDNNPISYTKTYYNIVKNSDETFSFNHLFSTINNPSGIIQENTVIGRDIEIMTDFREHETKTTTANLSFNTDLSFITIFPMLFMNMLQPFIQEGTRYRSAAVLKIVNRYGMIDSVVTVNKGSMVKTENLIYDGETGNPILTKVNNEQNKAVYNFSYPAHWAYSGMGPAYKNIDYEVSGLTFRNGILDEDIDMSAFESGDEIYAFSSPGTGPRPKLNCDNGSTINTTFPFGFNVRSPMIKSTENKIWAVNTSKVESLTPEFVFMDKDGKPYTAKEVRIRIIRSGHRNLLQNVVGNIISHKIPIEEVVINNLTVKKLVFNDEKRIIQASAATFKDHWKVDNDFYKYDSIVVQKRWTPVTDVSLTPEQIYSIGQYKYHGRNSNYFSSHYINHDVPNTFMARKQAYGSKRKWSKRKNKSWALFKDTDINLFTANRKILSAKLSLFTHPPKEASRHDFKYFNNPHNDPHTHRGHNNVNPLQFWNVSHNNFKINRMIGNWPANNSTNWLNNHFDNYEIANAENGVVVQGSQPLLNSNLSYSLGSSDNRIEFTNIFKAILRDKFDPQKQYSPAIKISMLDQNDGEKDASVCFSSMSIDVKYYDCSLVYPPEYVPSPNENVIECGETIFHQSFCLSKFSKNAINPYVQGIYGNWRPDLIYTYYGNRVEQNPLDDVDIRKAGAISNFEEFWNLNPDAESYYLTKNIATLAWSWVSESTQFNRKGYEIESKNPLGIFSSGLYGYNQQLPIATAGNSRAREILFEGFEDFGYSADNDCVDCRPRKHFNYEEDLIPDATQKHSGMYSVKIDPNDQVVITAPVVTQEFADQGYGIRIKVDSTSYNEVIVNGNGTGLRGMYYNSTNYSGSPVATVNSNINFQWGLGAPYGLNPNGFSVIWSGKIQPRFSEVYTFFKFSNDIKEVKINGNVIMSTNNSFGNISLQAGNSYDIEVKFIESLFGGDATAQLGWRSPSQIEEFIPTTQLYPYGTTIDMNQTVQTITHWCTKLSDVKVEGNAITDTFAPIQGKKMLVSAWVKESVNDCKCSTYVNNKIVLSYDGSSITEEFTPTGNIIEGWQRYEGVFTIPENAVEISISMQNLSGSIPVFFDDLRVQPFDAQMKTMVYHASNLRLTAMLDENNYAAFYEYDDDGTLTRVKKETVEGVKTIQETRSGLQTIINE